METRDHHELFLGGYRKRVDERLDDWERASFGRRLWDRDHTLWSDRPLPELTDRLGWLDLFDSSRDLPEELEPFAREIRAEGIEHVVLLGMGGSSLAPDMFHATFGARDDYPQLTVLDSSHPDAVKGTERFIRQEQSLFIVASKSGKTLETLALFKHFWAWSGKVVSDPGRHFIAITDPGTPLEELAEDRRFRGTFLAPTDLGGRYSALTAYGLVPAALIGIDIERLLERSRIAARVCSPDVPVRENPGLTLGAALGELALAGRNKLTFLATSSVADFPVWLEQLIAESTGKNGKGILPVIREPPASAELYGPDRFFVLFSMEGDNPDGYEGLLEELGAAGHPASVVRLSEKADIGREIFIWELAVAAAGSALGIHPFNQPDVELSKELAREAMYGGGVTGVEETMIDGDDLRSQLEQWLSLAGKGDYISIHAYLNPSEDTDRYLREIRDILLNRTGFATTADYGPRFLHSTGQLHKGGMNEGLFLQVVEQPRESVQVPGEAYSFADIIEAQSVGDFAALKRRGRRLIRVNLGDQGIYGLETIADALGTEE